MGKFRYKGVVVSGEKEDRDGNIVPNVVDSTELFGFKFNKRTYTVVPEDKVAYMGRVFDFETQRRKPSPVMVVDKLRANSHFEELTGGQQEATA